MAKKVEPAAIGVTMAGFLFAYSGIKGISVLQSIQWIVSGKSPETLAQTTAITVPADTSASGGGSSTGSVPASGPGVSASYRAAEMWWIAAGGPSSQASIAAAIADAESSLNVKAVQQGQPYATTGWGLWQITPGNSVPSVGVDNALLNGLTNAKAAVIKYKAAGNSFAPWTTYTSGKYKEFLK